MSLASAILAFDVETVPDFDIVRHEFSDILTGDSHNMSDDDVLMEVEKYLMDTKGNSFLPLQCHRIVALSGTLLRVKDKKPVYINTFRHNFSSNSSDYDEKGALSDFFSKLTGLSSNDTHLISWNGNNFDLPLMNLRCLKHLVPAPDFWDKNSHHKRFNNYITRYHDLHTDLMDTLALYGIGKVSLDAACKVSGIAGKTGIDGSQVYNLYKQGRLDEIAAYCETDTVSTMILYLRFCVMKGSITEEQYHYYYEIIKAEISKKTSDNKVFAAYYEAMA